MPETAVRIPRTQEERKAESERRIIRAAMEMFAQQGFMRTTISEVGKAAGYTGGLVSHRFGSKEMLLKAVVERMSSRYLRDQLKPSVVPDDPRRSIEAHVEAFFTELSAREKSVRALYVVMGEALGAVPEIQSDIAELNRGVRAIWEGTIERGKASGVFRADVDAKAHAVLILGLLRGITMQAITDKKAFDVKALLPLVKKQVLASLT